VITKGLATLSAASDRASGRRRAAARVALRATFSAALLAAVALAAFAVLAAGAAAPASAGPYVNPSPAEIRAKLNAAAVARLIPPKILYGIAFQESTWRQFDADGDPLIGFDGKGIGIMQVTTIPLGVDVERLKTDIGYNIEVGANILVEKWGYAPSVFPVIGGGDPRCYENWFFAVWAYNGWKAGNPYPYKVWGHIADGRGLWTGLAVTPVPTAWLVGGFPVPPVLAPQPEHWWSPMPLPKPVLSVPRVQKRVGVGDRFSVSGTLSPRHPAGATSVELRLYRWNGSRWVLRRAVLTTNRDGATADVTRWAATFALAKTGRWKLVAHAPADADHAATTSKPAFVTALR
jgi:hypothetical protein